MKAQIRIGELSLLHLGARRGPRTLVRAGIVVPEPELEKDVRGHVQGMLCGWRDLGVLSRRLEPARSIGRIVGGMNQIVRRARMTRVRAEDSLGDRDRL